MEWIGRGKSLSWRKIDGAVSRVESLSWRKIAGAVGRVDRSREELELEKESWSFR